MQQFTVLLILLALGSQSTNAQNLNSTESKVDFYISNFGFNSVNGTIYNLSGNADFNETQLELCSFDVCLDLSSINTGNEKRDAHLLTEDFFNVQKYPKACFVSQQVIAYEDGFLVTGTMSINGIERVMDIPFAYANKTFTGSLEMDRMDFNIGSKGGFMVGRIVKLNIIAKQN